jgi:hypothetical protein
MPKRMSWPVDYNLRVFSFIFSGSAPSVYIQNHKHEDRSKDKDAPSTNRRSGENQRGQIR